MDHHEERININQADHQTPHYQKGGEHCLSTLAPLSAITVVQKREFSGCCTIKNYYLVRRAHESGSEIYEEKDTPLFKCMDKSNCYQKCCYPEACRQQELFTKEYLYDNGHLRGKSKALILEKDYKFTLCCCNRPVMNVNLLDGANKVLIGQLINPWNCSDYQVNVHDQFGTLIYKIVADGCQCAMLCNCNCGSCKLIEFKLLNRDDMLIKSWTKKQRSGCGDCCEDHDWFKVLFPASSNPTEKTLLMSAAFYINFLYFDTMERQKNRDFTGRNGGISIRL